MGQEIDRILNQLERSYRAEAWHGPAVLEILAGVSAANAARRPLPAAHTIWELVLHMAYWKDIVRRRLAGERPETDDALNFPVITDASEAAWERAQARLEASHEELVRAIARLDDRQLDEPAPGGSTAQYVVLHGMVQHDLYHAGQIAILKKPAMKAAGPGRKVRSPGRAAARPKPAKRAATSRTARSAGGRKKKVAAARTKKAPAGRRGRPSKRRR